MTTTANGSGRRISVHDATIKTATVEVKTLTISGKQVTLAVFRQLQEEALLDLDTLQLRGLPWGTVNYHWKECCAGGEHLWVVWQTGTELRRTSVPRVMVTPRQVECRRLVLAVDNLWALLWSLDKKPSAVRLRGQRGVGVEFGEGPEAYFSTEYGTAQAIALVWGFSEYGGAYSEQRELSTHGRERLTDLIGKGVPPVGISPPPVGTTAERADAISLVAALRQERLDEDAAIAAKLTERWAELSALDQLFIAV